MAKNVVNPDDPAVKMHLAALKGSMSIKEELEIVVKPEFPECLVCQNRSHETFDIYGTTTDGSGAPLPVFLSKYANSDFTVTPNCSKYICKNCLELINVLEQAEIEYIKLKETFESIISKNPLFELSEQAIGLEPVKDESNTTANAYEDFAIDSEDEPLAVTKKKRRKPAKSKKKLGSSNKRKSKSKVEDIDKWVCNECGLEGEGGLEAEKAHKLEAHELSVKKEELPDGIRNYNNGYEDDTLHKIESNDFDDVDFNDIDDDSSNYMPEEEERPQKRKVGRPLKSKNSKLQKPVKKRERVVHKCDQCDAKYSSLVRLEQHLRKHDGSKPPYICEVCGAHYKHKRACDIHIALHKGISDWKCEECNKLFPSKGALARHNNIHTGKLNYQCDLCGKSFIHTSSFKMHKLSHSGLKPHSCDVCGLALMTRSHLMRHKRVHSGEKRHECPVCGKKFSERYNLVAHSKSHEAGAGGAGGAAGVGALAVAPPVARRHLFRCHFCVDRFERRYMLERHMSAVHGRALERPPPTPRNTMSKLLKAQAGRRHEAGAKSERSPPVSPQKIIAQLAGGAGGAGSWSSAYTEFNLRTDFPH